MASRFGIVSFAVIISGMATAQTVGQQAAAALRRQAAEQSLQRRGINVDLRGPDIHLHQHHYQSRRPAYGYGYGYPRYGYGYGFAPFGYSPYAYGDAPYGYSPYGYGTRYLSGLSVYHLGSGGGSMASRSNPIDGRQPTPGSHFFGRPHASQFYPARP